MWRRSQERRGGRSSDCSLARQRAGSSGSLPPMTSTWLSGRNSLTRNLLRQPVKRSARFTLPPGSASAFRSTAMNQNTAYSASSQYWHHGRTNNLLTEAEKDHERVWSQTPRPTTRSSRQVLTYLQPSMLMTSRAGTEDTIDKYVKCVEDFLAH
eukprot:8936661-Pyramimonas_sp.AAC.1